jgi:hypothetical protein
MRNRNRILFGLALVALMAVPLRAYQLALKNGQTIQFEKYHATETTVFYTGVDGKEIAIQLTDVDIHRTQELNSREAVPLDLPGLGVTNGSQPSLAEMARQQKKGTAGAGAKRVFTDDDMPHRSPAVAAVQTVPAPSAHAQVHAEPMHEIIDKFANKSQAQMANEAVSDMQFPGRGAWEQKLYVQGQRVLRFAQASLDRTKKLDTITDPAERDRNLEIAKNFEWQAHEEETVYDQLSEEGSQKAKESEKNPQ